MVRGYANQSNAYILTIAAEGAAPGEDAVTRVIQAVIK